MTNPSDPKAVVERLLAFAEAPRPILCDDAAMAVEAAQTITELVARVAAWEGRCDGKQIIIEQHEAHTLTLQSALERARDTFIDYEQMHLKKSPPDRTKAQRNAAHAAEIATTVASLKPGAGGVG